MYGAQGNACYLSNMLITKSEVNQSWDQSAATFPPSLGPKYLLQIRVLWESDIWCQLLAVPEPVAPPLGLGPPICTTGVIMSCLQVVARTQWDQSWISLMLGSLPHLGVTAAPEAPQTQECFVW